MKALTLTQPWASLVAVGIKKIETRSWRTSYRGPLAIHSQMPDTPQRSAEEILRELRKRARSFRRRYKETAGEPYDYGAHQLLLGATIALEEMVIWSTKDHPYRRACGCPGCLAEFSLKLERRHPPGFKY